MTMPFSCRSFASRCARWLVLLAVSAAGALAPTGAVRAQSSAPAIVYYGGPVVSSVRVVTLNWNGNVSSVASSTLPQFYADIVTPGVLAPKPYWMTLGAYYSTRGRVPQDSGATSDQLIGPGSALGASITLAPTLCPMTASTAICGVTEADVDTELNHQIDIGVVPAPDVDATGNVNTVYMVNFPPYVQLTIAGQTSCSGGGFCNATSTLVRGSQAIALGFLPDFGPNSACNVGCGSANVTDNTTYNASQALIDAVTDPQLGSATVLGRPLAWYDGTNGYQVATVPINFLGATGSSHCGRSASITVAGRTWLVAPVWLASANDCVFTPIDVNAFGLTANVAAVALKQGDSIDLSISATALAGSAQNIQLDTDALPPGLAVSFVPPTLAAVGGGSSTLQLSVAPAAALGVYHVNVLGVAQTGERAVTGFAVTVDDVLFANGFE